jgi:hypothetical protein
MDNNTKSRDERKDGRKGGCGGEVVVHGRG